jgi:hypothetical protein
MTKFAFKTEDSSRIKDRKKDISLISSNSRKNSNFLAPTSRDISSTNVKVEDEFIQNKYRTLIHGFFK